MADFVRYFKNFNKLIIFFIVTSFLFQLILAITYTYTYSKESEDYIKKTIVEYDEIDRTHLCNIINCDEIEIDNKFFIRNNSLLELQKFSKYKNETNFSFYNNIWVYPFSMELKYKLPDNQTFIYFSLPTSIKIVLIYFSIMSLIYGIIFIYFLTIYIKRVRATDLMNFSTEKAKLSTVITSVLTENLHHEMKTPLTVMSNELFNIEEYIKEDNNVNNCNKCNKCVPLKYKYVMDSISYIKVNLESIFSIVETIKMSKMIKYSNGDKSIYDIAQVAAKMIQISNKLKTFSIEIEDSLKKYSLKNFRNEDMMNIFINHLKNSIEANSTKVIFHNPSNELDDGGFLTFFIIDNGNGVPKKVINNIYDLHFSTKENVTDQQNSLRGIGLYLSREILRHYGKGDERLYSSSKDGTVFEIKVPAKIKKH